MDLRRKEKVAAYRQEQKRTCDENAKDNLLVDIHQPEIITTWRMSSWNTPFNWQCKIRQRAWDHILYTFAPTMNSYTFTFYCNTAFDKSVHTPTYQENFISRGRGKDWQSNCKNNNSNNAIAVLASAWLYLHIIWPQSKQRLNFGIAKANTLYWQRFIQLPSLWKSNTTNIVKGLQKLNIVCIDLNDRNFPLLRGKYIFRSMKHISVELQSI